MNSDSYEVRMTDHFSFKLLATDGKAFCGLERMRAAYGHAIANEYRFYSYGDACLLARG